MQTHGDRDHQPSRELLRQLGIEPEDTPQMKRLKERAAALGGKGADITAGPGETVLAEVESFGVHVTRLPDDEDCIRISIGEVRDEYQLRYLAFRGSPHAVLDLLKRAQRAVKVAWGI